MNYVLVAMICIAQDAPQSELMETLPHVASVNAKQIDNPTHYVIHILDWHFVPQETFIADLKELGVTDQLDAKYDEHLNDVEAVQHEQKELLLAMKKEYSVTEVYVEGLTKRDKAEYDSRVAQLRKLDLMLQLFRKLARNKDDMELKSKIRKTELLMRREMLRIGAAGQLQAEHVLQTLPVEDQASHEAARPLGDDGQVKLNAKLIEAREDAIVKNAMAGGPVTVLILGGAHDLSDNVPAECQYIRLGTKAYERMARTIASPR